MQAIETYQAIKEMRENTKQGKPFSFAFVSCSLSAKQSNGVVRVDKALIRSSNSLQKDKDIMLSYYDVDLQENRQCYQPLIIMYNNKTVELK